MFALGATTAKLCEGVTRREWLRVGGISSMGLMLPQLLAARAAGDEKPKDGGGSFGRAKSCIVCFLFGAPAHQDIWDLKPEASDDIRGEFEPIATSVPGTFFGEHIPRTAKLAHKFALIRSMTHPDATHTVAMHYMLTGQRHRRIRRRHRVSALTHLQGAARRAVRTSLGRWLSFCWSQMSASDGYMRLWCFCS